MSSNLQWDSILMPGLDARVKIQGESTLVEYCPKVIETSSTRILNQLFKWFLPIFMTKYPTSLSLSGLCGLFPELLWNLRKLEPMSSLCFPRQA